MSHLRANLWFLLFSMVLCSVLYPLVLLAIAQTPWLQDQAEGSLIRDSNEKPVGSRLIAQPFTGDYYFQPRPSAVSYNAAASGASNWAASNYLLRDRVARQLGPIVRYGKKADQFGKKPGRRVGPDIDAWFQKDRYQNRPGIVAQWTRQHPGLAEAWVKNAGEALKDQWKKADREPEPGECFASQWREDYPKLFLAWKKDHPDLTAAKPADLALPFFNRFSAAYPGYWPMLEEHEKRKKIVRVKEASDSQTEIQAVFFDMWRQDHPDIPLEAVPADMVMASGSGLDPHITLKNALYQLHYPTRAGSPRGVAEARAKKILDDGVEEKAKNSAVKDRSSLEKQLRKQLEDRLGKRLESRLEEVISELVHDHARSPLGGLTGVPLVNVLELNLALDFRVRRLLENGK